MSKIRQLGVALAFAAPSIALAQVGDLQSFNTTATNLITWVQGLAMLGGVVGFIRVGYMYTQGDDRAAQALKNTGIGTAIIAGATILMQFIKNSIG